MGALNRPERVLKFIHFRFTFIQFLSSLDVKGAVGVGVDPVVGNGAIVARGRLGAVRVEEHCRPSGIAQVD